jgi:polar amino acid transport system substrate-binding protein
MTLSFFSRPIARALVFAALSFCTFNSLANDAIHVVTEELPPYNMTRGGRLTGMSTEVVQAVLKEAGIEASIQSLPWARAYDTALNSENVLIYSIARTEQRENLFKWVGVVAPMSWYLYARADSTIYLESIDDARNYQIATVKQDAGEQYLTARGFVLGKNLQSSNKYEYNYEKLKLGRVDLWVSIELNALYLMRQAGDEPEKMIKRVLALPDLGGEGGLHMAFSLKTPDELVEKLREALETIHHNGTYDAILKKWL